jgi:ATP/maltotriose-dependent transcriptional regulator MalT
MRHQRRAAGALDDGPAPRRPLIVRREHAFLVVSPLIDGGRQLVLLEERVTVPAAELPVAAGLTLRETDVLILAAQGRSNREIAAVLDMGARTVDKHLERIYDRLRVRPRNAAVAHALRVLAAARARPRL